MIKIFSDILQLFSKYRSVQITEQLFNNESFGIIRFIITYYKTKNVKYKKKHYDFHNHYNNFYDDDYHNHMKIKFVLT